MRIFENNKKWVIAWIVIGLLFIDIHMASGMTVNLKDIKGHWAEKTVQDWVSRGLVKGYSDGTFKPDQTISRAEFIALANRTFGLTTKAQLNYKDLPPSHWAYGAFAVAAAAGYLVSFEDQTIRPNEFINRAEVALMIAKLSGLQPDAKLADKFKDRDQFSASVKGSIGIIAEQKLMGGYVDGTFKPTRLITRAETVVTLQRAALFNETNYYQIGTVGPASGSKIINRDATIYSKQLRMQNMTINGNLTLAESVGEGNVTLSNVLVNGAIVVKGGGSNSIIFQDVQATAVVVDKPSGDAVRIVAQGVTRIPQVDIRSSVKIEERNVTGTGFENITIDASLPDKAKIQMTGNFENIVANSKGTTIEMLSGKVNNIHVLNESEGIKLTLGSTVQVTTLTLDTAIQVTGSGKVAEIVSNDSPPSPGTANTSGNTGNTGNSGGSSNSSGTGGTTEPSSPFGPQAPSFGGGIITDTGGTGGGTTSSGGGTTSSGGNPPAIPSDVTPPAAPIVTGITNGSTYAISVLPNWIEATGVDFTATLSRNGLAAQNYTKGTIINADGSYVLTVTGTKTSNALKTATTVSFTIDKIVPPSPVITGVTNNTTYGANVTPTWTDLSDVTISATLTRNGAASQPFTKGTTISTEGSYVLTVQSIKTTNGLISNTAITFTIDKSPPAVPNITGVASGVIYGSAVSPTWLDAAGTTSTATLSLNSASSQSYTKGTTITADGSYTMVVTTTKTANGLTAFTTVSFQIDKVAPTAPTVTGVANGAEYAASVSPTWSEAAGTTSTATITRNSGDPQTYTKGTAITADGNYVLQVTRTKSSNNLTTTTTVSFKIDISAPAVPTVTGVTDGAAYGFAVTPSWVDVAGTVVTATIARNTAAPQTFNKGTTVQALGKYKLIVTRTKTSNGLTAATTINFEIVIPKSYTTIKVSADTKIEALQEKAISELMSLASSYTSTNDPEVKASLASQGQNKMAGYDAEFETIITQFEAELIKYGHSTAIISDYRAEYEAQKAVGLEILAGMVEP